MHVTNSMAKKERHFRVSFWNETVRCVCIVLLLRASDHKNGKSVFVQIVVLTAKNEDSFPFMC